VSDAEQGALVKDDFRLASALVVYADCLERNDRKLEAGNVRTQISRLRSSSDWVLMVLLVLASLATFGIYAANALLQDKLHLSNWRVYFWFTTMWYLRLCFLRHAYGIWFAACPCNVAIGGGVRRAAGVYGRLGGDGSVLRSDLESLHYLGYPAQREVVPSSGNSSILCEGQN
jgi:hypothetical protein